MSLSNVAQNAQNIEAIRELSMDDIKRLLPHREPMLMVDTLTDVVCGESAVGMKQTSSDDWYFKGHFPSKAVMPGVMIIEALAQTAAALAMHSLNLYDKEMLVYFMGIDEAKFRKMVFPGDVLHLEVTRTHRRGNVWRFKGVARVNGEVAAEAVKTAMIAEK